MLRCPACQKTTSPLRHLTVTPRRPYRCGGCGAELEVAPSLSAFAGLLVAGMLLFFAMEVLAAPLALRLPVMAVAAMLLLWLLLPLRPVDDPTREDGDGEEDPS